MRGEISGTSKAEGIDFDESPWTISKDASGWTLRGENASYILCDLNGRVLEMGKFFNELHVPINKRATILQLRSDHQVKSFKLVK